MGDDEKADKTALQRIKREMLEKKKEIKRADRKERSILSELEKIDRGIQSGGAELADHQQRLRDAEAALRGGRAEQHRDQPQTCRAKATLWSALAGALQDEPERKHGDFLVGQFGRFPEAGHVPQYDSRTGPHGHAGVRQRARPACGSPGRDCARKKKAFLHASGTSRSQGRISKRRSARKPRSSPT